MLLPELKVRQDNAEFRAALLLAQIVERKHVFNTQVEPVAHDAVGLTRYALSHCSNGTCEVVWKPAKR